jgi:hypothetical protein
MPRKKVRLGNAIFVMNMTFGYGNKRKPLGVIDRSALGNCRC